MRHTKGTGHAKGTGFLDDLKDYGISAAKDVARELAPIAREYAISAAKSALTKKEGKGLYAAMPRGSGFTLTPAQGRALVAGKGIQLKPSMIGGEYDLEMTPAMEKKMMRTFAKGKGMRVSSKNLKGVKKGGFVVPLLMTAARIAAPIIIEKLAEAGIKKLGGGAHIAKGEGLYAATKVLQQSMGMGLFAGGDVIQTGSPYQSTNSPAMSPFIPTRNPFGMYVPL